MIGIFFLVDDRAVHYLGVASDDDTGMIRSAAITVLVVGFISLAIGVLGCWGATRHYGAILFIVSVNSFAMVSVVGFCILLYTQSSIS